MYRTLVQMFMEKADARPLAVAQLGKNRQGQFVPTSYIQLQEKVYDLASSLSHLGLKRGDKVGIISDNRCQWLEADLAILSLGAIDVPRGRDAMNHELVYILQVTGTAICFVENRVQLDKILEVKKSLPGLRTIIVMDDEKKEEYPLEEMNAEYGVAILFQDALIAAGHERMADQFENVRIKREIQLGGEEDLATIIFTSGTTGTPKGVQLTHGNMLYQMQPISDYAPIDDEKVWLSVLPVWHSFERIIQYLAIYHTSALAYSKPIGKIMLMDFMYAQPSYMGSVPRIWETVKSGVFAAMKQKSAFQKKAFAFFLSVGKRYQHYKAMVSGGIPHFRRQSRLLEKLVGVLPFLLYYPLNKLGDLLVFRAIKAKFGKNFVCGVSGGGSMSKDVRDFFTAIGMVLIDGYGLTETAPIVGGTSMYHPQVGYLYPMKGTDIKVVDEESARVCAPGEKGVLFVKGPQVMKGYYKAPELTAKAFDKDGYFNTGDNARMTIDGLFTICGRAKDTIVLSGGENIEPVPIEAKLQESEFIETAVVVGQDQKYLGVLIVPDEKQIERYFKEMHVPYLNREELDGMHEVETLINREIQLKVNGKTGFKPFEQISRFVILKESFQVNRELSAKQEIKRSAVSHLYAKEIDTLYSVK